MMAAAEDMTHGVGKRRVAAVGVFDGVHRGHRHLIDQVKAEASARGLAPAVVTFRSHPSQLLTPDRPVKLLSTPRSKLSMLADAGITDVVMLDFDECLRSLTSREFLKYIHDSLGVDCLVVGFNNRFGSDRTATFADYCRYGREVGVDIVQATESPDCRVSSSIIRRCIAEGRVDEASGLLGYRYSLSGTVVGGHRVGRNIGYPTANLRVADSSLLVPANGVYAAYAYLDDDPRPHRAMVNIGTRPTAANGTDVTIEAHILDFSGDIYDRLMRLEFVGRLREEMQFPSLEALSEQLGRDAEATRRILP